VPGQLALVAGDRAAHAILEYHVGRRICVQHLLARHRMSLVAWIEEQLICDGDNPAKLIQIKYVGCRTLAFAVS
jgi:hypothetical protein